MPSQIEHSGVVSRIVGDTVHVTITSHSACGSCKARQACGLAETQEKIVEVHTPESGSYHPGEEVSVGGESGPEARLCDYEWVLDIRNQCLEAGIPFVYHQTGALLRKDGHIYHIARRYQHSQARRAGINHTGSIG